MSNSVLPPPEALHSEPTTKKRRLLARIPKTALAIVAVAFAAFVFSTITGQKKISDDPLSDALSNGFFAALLGSAVATYFATVIISGLKGKPFFVVMGLIALAKPAVSFLPLIGAIRIAKPNSTWARKYYGEEKMRISRARFQQTAKQSNTIPNAPTAMPAATDKTSSKGIVAVTLIGISLLCVLYFIVFLVYRQKQDSVAKSTATIQNPPARSSSVPVDHLSPDSNSRGTSFSSPSATPLEIHDKTITGRRRSYSLTVPGDWSVQYEQEDFDVIADRETRFIGVIAEEANLGSIQKVIELTQQYLNKDGKEVVVSQSSPIEIDGRRWQGFSAKAHMQGVPFEYQFYVYTGPEGTYQVIAWTFENLFDRVLGQFQEIAQSFKFPEPERLSNSSPSGQDHFKPVGTVAAIGEMDLPTLAKNARPAVLLIVGFDANGKAIKTGSGFFVSPYGAVVTNWHVVDGVVQAVAKTEAGAIYTIAGVLASSANLDLAVLKADAKGVPFLSVEETDLPETGTKVAVIGSPLALEGTVSEGIVSAVRNLEDGTWIQISAPVSPGSSGSPVLNSHGRVVGIATLNSDGRYQSLNFARSSRDLVALALSIPKHAKPKAFREIAPTKAATKQMYHIVGISDEDVLNVREGPSSNYPVILKLRSGQGGITLEGDRSVNGTTTWQKVFVNGFHGWVNADYLLSDPATP